MIKMQGKSFMIGHDETLTITRDGAVTYVNGKPVAASGSTFQIKCNVQPVSGFELLIMPEADRFKEQYWVWTETTDIHLLKDKVTRNGVIFQVQQLKPWGTYLQFRMVRVDVGPDATDTL